MHSLVIHSVLFGLFCSCVSFTMQSPEEFDVEDLKNAEMTETMTKCNFLPPRSFLPEKLVVGYANWNQCDDKIIQAVKDGVNVVIWFATNLSMDESGNSVVTSGPDMDCVADIILSLRELQLPTVHLISIGGWNSPHPDTSNSAEAVYSSWDYWNRNIAARPEKGFYGFDGFDWDNEGNDDFSSPYNQFTVECLDLMGRMSQLAKAKGNYIVSMAPAESYLDPTTSLFDRSLLHEYDEWKELQPGFSYHGHNTYAYLLDKYGHYSKNNTICNNTTDTTTTLYEGYSHAEYNTSILKQSTAEYIASFVRRVNAGWTVDFAADRELSYPVNSLLRVKGTELVVGLANGWAGDGKFFLAYPDEVEVAYMELSKSSETPRGFAFWNILDEGRASSQRPDEPVWMAKGLNKFLHTRKL